MSGCGKRIAHGGIGTDWVYIFGIAPIVFQIVDAPLGIGARILIFVTATAGITGTGGITSIGINTDFQTFGMYVISQRFHTRWKFLFVDLDIALGIAFAVPA